MTLRAIDWRSDPRAQPYLELIEKSAEDADIPVDVLGGVLFHESGFDPNARNDSGDEGIAQLNKRWHRDVDRFNPDEAIPYAARHLAQLNDKFDGSWDHTIAAYNDGEADVGRYDPNDFDGSLPPITRNYVNNVSPDRVTYPATQAQIDAADPLLAMAKQADASRSTEAQDATELLEAMRAESEVEENLRTRGWLLDTAVGFARGPIKAVRAFYSSVANVAEAITARTGDVQFNIGNDRPIFEVLSPEQARARNVDSDLVEKGVDVPLNALGATETIPGLIAEYGSQALVGFAATRRITGAFQAMRGTSNLAKVTQNMVNGGITSGVFFEGDEQNLANLIESSKGASGFPFPDLSNAITAALAVDEDDSDAMGRVKNAITDAVGGLALEPIMALIGRVKFGRKLKREATEDAADTRPEMDIDRVAAKPMAVHEPLPAVTKDLPEVSAKAEASTPKVSLEADAASGEIIVRSDNGLALADDTGREIRMRRSDVAEAARRKGEGLALLRRFAQHAQSRGLPLTSDVSVSPAQAGVWEKLKAEGFNVQRNEAHVNPETGNLVSVDPRKSVFEAAPTKQAEVAPKVIDEAAPQAAPMTTARVEPKPDYGTSPVDVSEARLREEIGLTDEVVADVRAKLASGKVKPEEVADLIGINGARIDWTGVADEKAMAGMLNAVARTIDNVVGGAARYSRVSVETVEKVVGKIGASAEDALDLFNSLKAKGGIEARLMAARITLNASAAKLFRLGNLVHTGQGTPEDLLELAIHDRRHMLLQATVRGSGSMVARALRLMRESVTVEESAFNLSKARHERAVRKAQEGVDAAKRKRSTKPKAEGESKTTPEDSALEHATAVLDNAKKAGRRLSDSDVEEALGHMGYTPKQVNRLARVIAQAKKVEDIHAIARSVSWGKELQGRLATLYINNILSGLPTLAINVTSGWLKMAESIVERYGAAVIGMARGGDKYELLAAHRAAIATRVMWGDAWKIASQAWKEGLPQVDLFGRVEVAIKGGTGRSVGEKIITAPSRAILTIDEYFKNIFYQQELHARAVEIAAGKARLFKGKAAKQVFDQEFREVISNPTDDVRLDAIENARYQTFQNALKSDFSNGLIRWTNGTPALKFVVPFVRTPVNIVKQALDRSVLSPLQLAKFDMRQLIASGSREGNTQLFRMTLAVSAFGVIFDKSLDGDITGSRVGGKSGKNSADFDQPVPYLIGDVQVNRLDPWGTVIGLTADLARLYNEHRLTKDESEELSPDLVEAFSNVMAILHVNITDKTFFKGISDAVEALSGEEEKMQRFKNYFAQLATNLVPFSSLQRNLARAHDEYAREAFSFSDKLMAQIPFLREHLPIRRDYLGRPIPETERLGPDWLSPIAIAKDDNDPVAKAFAELEMPYRMPDKTIGGVQLSPKQYSKLVEIRGQFIYERIKDRLDSGEWGKSPVFQRQDMVRAWAEEGGRKARAALLHDTTDTLGATVSRREAALDALREAAE